MAGPGIRYHYMAKLLSEDFNVTIGFFDESYLPGDDFPRPYDVLHIDAGDFEKGFGGFQVVISMWLNMQMINYCNNNLIFVVFDMYAPTPVENLALYMLNGEETKGDTDYIYSQSNIMLKHFLTNGDLFLFSNQRQLDFWTGFLFGTDQVRVSGFKTRNFFDRFIYAPMGIDTKSELRHDKRVLRGVVSGISQEDKILIWTGGIWNWFDAQVLIKAMGILKNKRPDIKLVFFGTKHPNPDVPAMQEASDAFSLAKELGLLDETVFMYDGWVPYIERTNYLIEADAAVNTTKDTIESEFSHRTRVLDHFLCRLPTLATKGDYLTDVVVVPNNLGIAVKPGDERALADAIVHILDPALNETMVNNIDKMRSKYDWENTLSPLRDALVANLPKLPYVPFIEQPKQLPSNKIIAVGKKILPTAVKKMILRALKYGQ